MDTKAHTWYAELASLLYKNIGIFSLENVRVFSLENNIK